MDAGARCDRIRGCLLAGAVGDALGAPVEFLTLPQIRSRYGPDGVTGYVEGYHGYAVITDDTQMTLFTAEALLEAPTTNDPEVPEDARARLWAAYRRWLHTQQVPWQEVAADAGPLAGLVEDSRLHARRAPGATCIRALRDGVPGGTGARALNDSKGCGTLMRVAPVGLLGLPAETTFRLGVEAGALTHGHPSGYLASGAQAVLVAEMIAGTPLPNAVEVALDLLADQPEHEEATAALEVAVAAAAGGDLSPEAVEEVGAGWVAEEALAVAVYCALAAPDLPAALLAAVNHSGDSDSTGAICGNLVGARDGLAAIPPAWLEPLEAVDLVRRVADDLCARVARHVPS